MNVAALLLVASFNLIDCISANKALDRYLLFVLPFVCVAIVPLLWRNYKVNAVLYAACGLVATATGSTGNFSGAIFLVFSIYIFNTALTNYTLSAACAVIIAAKHVFLGFTIPEVVNLFVVYAFVFGIYFILIHPKPEPKPIVARVDDTDIEIVNYLQDGMQAKEIGAEIGLSPSAVYKRIERARVKYFCDSNIELAQKFVRLGLISPKTDNSA
jgi:DNA-binding NarL/FixJ family response regulator